MIYLDLMTMAVAASTPLVVVAVVYRLLRAALEVLREAAVELNAWWRFATVMQEVTR